MYYKSLIHVNEFFQCCKELNKDLKCELTACISERTDIPNVFQTLKMKSKTFKLRQVALKRKDPKAPPCASLTEVKQCLQLHLWCKHLSQTGSHIQWEGTDLFYASLRAHCVRKALMKESLRSRRMIDCTFKIDKSDPVIPLLKNSLLHSLHRIVSRGRSRPHSGSLNSCFSTLSQWSSLVTAWQGPHS